MAKETPFFFFSYLRPWAYWAVMVFLGAGPTWAVAEEILPEYKMKAIFLLRLADYTYWPEEISQKKEFVIGILGEDPFQGYLETLAARNNQRKDENIRIQYYRRPEEVGRPQILFLGSQSEQDQATLPAMVKNQPILTVSDREGFIDNCGIVLFFRFKERVALGINHHQAKAQQLRISAKLLRLAKIMEPDHPELCR